MQKSLSLSCMCNSLLDFSAKFVLLHVRSLVTRLNIVKEPHHGRRAGVQYVVSCGVSASLWAPGLRPGPRVQRPGFNIGAAPYPCTYLIRLSTSNCSIAPCAPPYNFQHAVCWRASLSLQIVGYGTAYFRIEQTESPPRPLQDLLPCTATRLLYLVPHSCPLDQTRQSAANDQTSVATKKEKTEKNGTLRTSTLVNL